MQLPGADTGAVYNMGGSGVANYVSILRNVQGLTTQDARGRDDSLTED